MKQSISIKKRKELKNKIAKVFENEMQSVPVSFRKIMADDLITAFENRIFALVRSQSNLKFLAVPEGGNIQLETI